MRPVEGQWLVPDRMPSQGQSWDWVPALLAPGLCALFTDLLLEEWHDLFPRQNTPDLTRSGAKRPGRAAGMWGWMEATFSTNMRVMKIIFVCTSGDHLDIFEIYN